MLSLEDCCHCYWLSPLVLSPGCCHICCHWEVVVAGVLDPRSNEEVSMQQAVMLGIIDSQKGLYVNSTTGEKIPIPVAMNAGWIKVRFTYI